MIKKAYLCLVIILLSFCACIRTDAEELSENEIESFDRLPEDKVLINVDKKYSIDELQKLMPDKLEVTLKGNDSKTSIDVKWECITGNYDNTEFYCYQFTPKWDETKYSISKDLDRYENIPYIFVCLGEKFSDVSELSKATPENNSNMASIINYLTKTMGFSSAAACGAAANIYCESGAVSDIIEYGYTWESGGGYGMCQWTNYPKTSPTGRRTNLVNYCIRLGYDYKTLKSQLAFLNYEMSTSYVSVLNGLKAINCSSSPQTDSYNAAYLWCSQFEMPADTENTSKVRGDFAKTIWSYYGDKTVKSASPVLSGYYVPTAISIGRGFSVAGKLTSPTAMSKVKVAIVTSTGSSVCSKSVAVNSKTYDLSAVDKYITFDKLAKGMYYYKIIVDNESGTYTLVSKDFTVSDVTPMITGNNIPTVIACGKDMNVYGKISCSEPIIAVKAGIYTKSAGTGVKSESSISTASNVVDLAAINPTLSFAKIAGGKYYYIVTAETQAGTYVVSNNLFTISPADIAQVTGISRLSGTSSTISLKWKRVSGVTGYKVYRSNSQNGTYKRIATLKGSTTVQFTDKSLSKSTEYYYKIYAYITKNSITTNGKASNIYAAGTNQLANTYKKTVANISMYTGPGLTYSKRLTIKKGIKVQLLYQTYDKNNTKWYVIKYGTKRGYIKKSWVK